MHKFFGSLNLFVVVVLLELEWIYRDVIALGLSKLFTLAEFLTLVSNNLLFNLQFKETYLAFAFVLFHLYGHFGRFFYFLLFGSWDCEFVFVHELGENGVQNGFLFFEFDVILFCEFISFGLGFGVGLRIKNIQGIVHFIESDGLLDKFKSLLSWLAFG